MCVYGGGWGEVSGFPPGISKQLPEMLLCKIITTHRTMKLNFESQQ